MLPQRLYKGRVISELKQWAAVAKRDPKMVPLLAMGDNLLRVRMKVKCKVESDSVQPQSSQFDIRRDCDS